MSKDAMKLIDRDEIPQLYAIIADSEIFLKEDPADDGEYAGLLYIQETLARCNILREKLSSLQLRVGLTTSQSNRRLSAYKLAERVLRNPGSYDEEQVKKISKEYTRDSLKDRIEQEMLKIKEMHLLEDALKNRVDTLKRANSDIRLQSKVLEDQIYLSHLGGGRPTGLRSKMEGKGKKESSTPTDAEAPTVVEGVQDLTDDEIESLVNTERS